MSRNIINCVFFPVLFFLILGLILCIFLLINISTSHTLWNTDNYISYYCKDDDLNRRLFDTLGIVTYACSSVACLLVSIKIIMFNNEYKNVIICYPQIGIFYGLVLFFKFLSSYVMYFVYDIHVLDFALTLLLGYIIPSINTAKFIIGIDEFNWDPFVSLLWIESCIISFFIFFIGFLGAGLNIDMYISIIIAQSLYAFLSSIIISKKTQRKNNRYLIYLSFIINAIGIIVYIIRDCDIFVSPDFFWNTSSSISYFLYFIWMVSIGYDTITDVVLI